MSETSSELGVNKFGNALLLRAWGETDRETVAITFDADGVRRFIASEITGDADDQFIVDVLERIKANDWHEIRELDWYFEVGGLFIADCNAAASVKGE
jgi:hypothetical protein